MVERIWKPMKSSADLPEGPVLVRADFLPSGFLVGDGVGNIGWRGARKPGVWVADLFWPDDGPANFTHFTKIPDFDGE